MRYVLKLHPHSRCDAVASLEVDVALEAPGRLLLHYHLIGNLAELRMPPPSAAERADRLWEHLCFEAFVPAGAGAAYYEFNFAPSTAWAAYRLENHRSGMTLAAVEPHVEVSLNADWLELSAEIHLPPDTGNALGLSAVIEEASGRKSYWALAHPPGEPDFHHKDCFAAQVPE
jgi:hypothetical protein